MCCDHEEVAGDRRLTFSLRSSVGLSVVDADAFIGAWEHWASSCFALGFIAPIPPGWTWLPGHAPSENL
jgi:hypothetical protein